ncbi:MAG: hypothetical protein ACXAAO_05100 [Candidatus Thorarchaeota archaeon]
MDLIQYIIVVAIIVTSGGWCLDSVFSGTYDPIYVKDAGVEIDHREFSITCHVCGEHGTFSLPVDSTTKEVKCKRCGSFLSE